MYHSGLLTEPRWTNTNVLVLRRFEDLWLLEKRPFNASVTHVRTFVALPLCISLGVLLHPQHTISRFLCALVNATEKAAAQTASRLAENSRHKLRRLALQKQQEELGLQPLAELHEPTRDMLVRQEEPGNA